MKVKALKPTGIQYVTISMLLGTTTNGEPETYRRQDNVFVCVQDTAFTVWSAASVSESELQPTERLSDVLPNQQSHQVLYITTCCVGCGNLSDFSTTVLHLSRWCSEEALWRSRMEAFRYSIARFSHRLSREAPW